MPLLMLHGVKKQDFTSRELAVSTAHHLPMVASVAVAVGNGMKATQETTTMKALDKKIGETWTTLPRARRPACTSMLSSTLRGMHTVY